MCTKLENDIFVLNKVFVWLNKGLIWGWVADTQTKWTSFHIFLSELFVFQQTAVYNFLQGHKAAA